MSLLVCINMFLIIIFYFIKDIKIELKYVEQFPRYWIGNPTGCKINLRGCDMINGAAKETFFYN